MFNERLDIDFDRFGHSNVLDIQTRDIQVNRHPINPLNLRIVRLRHLGQETLLPIARTL
jgi:hypothetical protein